MSQVHECRPARKYDAFEHLRQSLFARRGDFFSMLTAYFDDSGTSPTDNVAVVAGCLGTIKTWETFNRRWTSLLSQYSIKRLHRVELENFQGDFKKWDPDKRSEFLKKAHTIIRHCTYAGIGMALIKTDYDARSEERRVGKECRL